MKKIVLLSLLPLFLAHCASVSTLQTARVLKEGESQHSIGLSMYSSDDFIGGDDISVPLIEYTYRRGEWENMDWGVKISGMSAIGDLKYNFVNGEEWAVATGFGLGYTSFTSTVAGQDLDSTIIDLIVPLYVSYDMSKMSSLYSGFKYMYRSISSDATVDGSGSLASGTFGVKWGQTSGVFLEGSIIAGLENDFAGTQFNANYFFEL